MRIGNTRSPGLTLVLCFITCGLYYFYFMYVVTEEMNAYTGRQDRSPILEILLTIVTCGIWDFVWDYNTGKRMAEMQVMAGPPPTDNTLIYLLLDFFQFGIINAYLQQEILNRIWSARPPYGGGGYYQDLGAYPPPPSSNY